VLSWQLRHHRRDGGAAENRQSLVVLVGGARIKVAGKTKRLMSNYDPYNAVYIDARSYTFDDRTWTFPEGLAHELLHAHDWLTDNQRRLDPLEQGHGDGFMEEEETITKEARGCHE